MMRDKQTALVFAAMHDLCHCPLFDTELCHALGTQHNKIHVCILYVNSILNSKCKFFFFKKSINLHCFQVSRCGGYLFNENQLIKFHGTFEVMYIQFGWTEPNTLPTMYMQHMNAETKNYIIFRSFASFILWDVCVCYVCVSSVGVFKIWKSILFAIARIRVYVKNKQMSHHQQLKLRENG